MVSRTDVSSGFGLSTREPHRPSTTGVFGRKAHGRPQSVAPTDWPQRCPECAEATTRRSQTALHELEMDARSCSGPGPGRSSLPFPGLKRNQRRGTRGEDTLRHLTFLFGSWLSGRAKPTKKEVYPGESQLDAAVWTTGHGSVEWIRGPAVSRLHTRRGGRGRTWGERCLGRTRGRRRRRDGGVFW